MEKESFSTDDFIISDHITPPPKTIPTEIQLVRKVAVRDWCLAVCQYKGYTYVGLYDGGVDRIDDQGNVTSKFIETAGSVVSARAHNDRLYIMMDGEAQGLCAYDMVGQLINSWETKDDGCILGQCIINIINDQLAVVCSACQQLTLYTLNGDFVKNVPCPSRSKDSDASMCEVDDDSVIITYCASSQVFKLNLSSGEEEWVSTHVDKPQGVVCYGGEYVLVTSRGKQTKLWILNTNDGGVVGELAADHTIRDEDTPIFDLYIDGDTLIVPRCNEKSVLYYKLQ